VSCQRTIYHRLFKSLLNGRNEFPRNNTTNDIIDKLQTVFAIVTGSKLKQDIGKFSATTGLFLVHFLMFNGLGKRFFVSNLRGTLIDLNFELAFQPVNNDLQVQLTHSAK